MATPMALRSGHHLLHGRVGKLRRRSRRDGALQVDIDAEVEVAVAGQPKKRTFRKDSYRGVDLNVLLDMSTNDLSSSYPSVPAEVPQGLKRKPMVPSRVCVRWFPLRSISSILGC
ncbi:hypothetical protein BDA96_07G126300 [Sorghum bicolor]|uniref:Uncharacterized protein n=1 Tax=Sorghum bicolor TaxID=4558 RepID=A0A921QMX8_SORBI|nr:hypothetical protein BDA96_07G126300 [Sorghum bicolor]